MRLSALKGELFGAPSFRSYHRPTLYPGPGFIGELPSYLSSATPSRCTSKTRTETPARHRRKSVGAIWDAVPPFAITVYCAPSSGWNSLIGIIRSSSPAGGGSWSPSRATMTSWYSPGRAARTSFRIPSSDRPRKRTRYCIPHLSFLTPFILSISSWEASFYRRYSRRGRKSLADTRKNFWALPATLVSDVFHRDQPVYHKPIKMSIV